MTYSSGSTVIWKIIQETVYGQTPASPTMDTLRLKPSNLNLKRDSYTSEEVRSDRGVSDVRLGMRKVEGSLDGDLLRTNYDKLLEGGLQGAWTNNILTCGTTLRSYSIEQGFTDIAQYRLFKGCCVDKIKFSIKPGSMCSISIDVMGQDATQAGTSAANVTNAPCSDSPVSYAGGSILEGGIANAYITGLDFELNNGLGAVGVIGSDVTPEVFNGRCEVKGTITALFKDLVMLNKFLNETESSLNIKLTDPALKSLGIIIPRIKYSGSDVNPPKEGPTIITLPFMGLMAPKKTCVSLTSLQVTASTKTFTRVGGSFVTDGFAVGDVITTSSFTAPANNGQFLVTAVTATTLVCADATGLVDQAAGVGSIVANANTLTLTRF